MNDTLWINLKVLGKLPAFAKLNTFHELFYIEKGTFLQSDRYMEIIKRR